jgi:hypothetical protein
MLGATKKLDRLLTRGKEMIGQEVKTSTTDDFKQLEAEMNLRHEGESQQELRSFCDHD